MTNQLAADEVDGAAPRAAASDDAVSARGSSGRRRRVSKWDRPPDPHDWRFFVGTLGKILIATGTLLFGFVAYQLWGTGIETARAQSSLEDQFETLLAERAATIDDATDTDDTTDTDVTTDVTTDGTTDVTTDGTTDVTTDGTTDVTTDVTTDGTTDVTDPVTDDATDPTGDVTDPADGVGTDTPTVTVDGTVDDPAVGPDPSGDDPAATDDPAVEPATDDAAQGDADGDTRADQAVEQDLPPIVRGEVLARLEIPRIGKTGGDALYVVPGVGVDDLKKGPGHYPDTPLPGQLGNSSIAGHRTTYGEPFFDIDRMQPGDEIIVTMASGDRFVYDVTGVEVVGASEYWVVTTRNPDVAELTLTSCHPKYTARDRIVVHSLLNEEKSARVGVPTFYDLDDADDEPIPGDDPVIGTEDPDDDTDPVTVGDDDPGDDVDDSSAVGDDATADADDDAGAAAGSDDPAGPPSATAEDAFARGWFHDRGAFPQIALWGLALTLISLAAYALSRRLRHDSIGLLVGIAPFVVALYFFFQNVNRLLPPGL